MNIATFTQKKDTFVRYLDVQKNASKHTVYSYKSDFDQFINFWQEALDAQPTTTLKDALDKFFMRLYHKKIAASSIARKISTFKSLEKFLEKEGISLKLNLVRPRLEKKLPVYLSLDEMFKILEADQLALPTKLPLRDKAILELLYATGIRCAELVNIKLRDVDSVNKTILIRGKGKKERLVLFNDATQKRLENFIAIERADLHVESEYLFTNNFGVQLSSRTIQRVIKMFRNFLTIEKKITPHKIRHTFATHLLNQGLDIRVLQELLGHRSLASTEKYTHVTLGQLTEICNTIHPINAMKQKREVTP